jgi:phage-related protein
MAVVVRVFGEANMAQVNAAQADLNKVKAGVAGQTGVWSKFSNVVSGAWAKLGSGFAALEVIKWLKGSISATQQYQLVLQQLKTSVMATNGVVSKHAAALAAVRKAAISVRAAQLTLATATERAAKAEKDHGKASLEYKTAAFAVQQAERNLSAAQKTHRQDLDALRHSVTTTTVSWDSYSKKMQTVVTAEGNIAAYTKTQLMTALATLTQTTGSAGKGLKLLGLSADLARAKNMDLTKAAQLVGKVAMGNTTVLKRYGIVMDKGTTSTQALGILQKKFGGQAKIYGDSSAGATAKLSNALHDLQVAVGSALLPTFNKLISYLIRGLGAFQKLPGPVKTAAVAFAALTVSGAILAPWFRTISSVVGGTAGLFVKAAGGISNFATGLTNSTAAGSAFATPMMKLGGLVSTAASAIAGLVVKVVTAGAAFVVSTAQLVAHTVATVASAVATGAVTVATTAWTVAQWLLNVALDANPIGIIIIAIAAFVGALILAWQHCGTFRAIVIGAWNAIKGATITDFNAVKAIILAVWGAIKTGASAVRSVVVGAWNGIRSGATAAFGAVRSFVVGVWNGIKNAAVTAFNAVVTFVRGIPKKITNAIGNLGTILYNAGVSIISGLLKGITDKFEAVKNFVGGIASWISSHKGPLSYDLVMLQPAGQAIMQGLINGIESQKSSLVKTLGGINASIAVGGGYGSPAFAGIGGASSGAGGAGVSITLVQNIDARGSSLSTADIKGAASDGAAPALERLAREVRMVVRH